MDLSKLPVEGGVRLRGEQVTPHGVLIACTCGSIAVALLIPPEIAWMQALPGMVYGLLSVAMPVLGMRYSKRIEALAAQRGAS